MSFYTSSSSIGSCNACGSPVNGGGQSGAYCSNNRCRNGYLGGKTLAQIDAEQAERKRKFMADYDRGWRVHCQDDDLYPSGVSGSFKTREEAVAFVDRERARGHTNVRVERIIQGVGFAPASEDTLRRRGDRTATAEPGL